MIFRCSAFLVPVFRKTLDWSRHSQRWEEYRLKLTAERDTKAQLCVWIRDGYIWLHMYRIAEQVLHSQQILKNVILPTSDDMCVLALFSFDGASAIWGAVDSSVFPVPGQAASWPSWALSEQGKLNPWESILGCEVSEKYPKVKYLKVKKYPKILSPNTQWHPATSNQSTQELPGSGRKAAPFASGREIAWVDVDVMSMFSETAESSGITLNL